NRTYALLIARLVEEPDEDTDEKPCERIAWIVADHLPEIDDSILQEPVQPVPLITTELNLLTLYGEMLRANGLWKGAPLLFITLTLPGGGYYFFIDRLHRSAGEYDFKHGIFRLPSHGNATHTVARNPSDSLVDTRTTKAVTRLLYKQGPVT